MTDFELPIDDGGPAFPVPPKRDRDTQEGMTLRQYYAKGAMEGLIAHMRHHEPSGQSPPNAIVVAQMAFKYADAMIAFEAQEVAGG